MLNPLSRILLGAAGLLAALAGMYMIGHIDGVREARRDANAAHAASMEQAIQQAAQVAKRDAQVLSADVARQTRVVTKFITIDREVNRYALTHRDAVDCLDADGLRVWSAASRGDAAEIAGAAPNDAGSVPVDVAGTGDSRRPGPAEQLHPGGEALSPAAGAVSEPGGVGAGAEPRPGRFLKPDGAEQAEPRPDRFLKPVRSEQTKPHWGW